MNEQQLMESLHRVRDDIVVGPPPVLRVHAAAARRRRRTRVGVAAAAAAAVVVVGATVVLHDGSDRAAPDPAVRLVENPAPVAWWGDGWLHVAHAAVELPEPDFIQPVGDGVVIWTQATPGGTESPIIHVADDGTRTIIATRRGGWMLAADPETGWVAWVDHPWDRAVALQLVVYDLRAGEEIARRELPRRGPRWQVLDEGPYPIAIEDGAVFYAAEDGDYRWDVGGGSEPARITDPHDYLTAHASGVDLLTTYDPTRGYHDQRVGHGGSEVPLPHIDGRTRLSPDGRYVSFTKEWEGGQAKVFDWETGQVLSSSVVRRRVIHSAFAADGTITYVLGTPHRLEETEGGISPLRGKVFGAPFSLVTCEIATASCSTVVDDIGGDAGVVLPE